MFKSNEIYRNRIYRHDFTDLPFGITQCKWDKVIDIEMMWKDFNRIIKPNGAIVLFSMQPFTAKLILSNEKIFRYEWIWRKTNAKGHLNAKKMPLRGHENILVFYKRLPVYNPQMTSGHERKVSTSRYRSVGGVYGAESRNTHYDSTERYPVDVIAFSNPNLHSNFHNTQKPVDLCEYFILTYTRPGDVVYDACTGSGSIPVACVRTGRNFIATEKEENFYILADKRIKEEISKYEL